MTIILLWFLIGFLGIMLMFDINREIDYYAFKNILLQITVSLMFSFVGIGSLYVFFEMLYYKIFDKEIFDIMQRSIKDLLIWNSDESLNNEKEKIKELKMNRKNIR
jgi:hypothetical protein